MKLSGKFCLAPHLINYNLLLAHSLTNFQFPILPWEKFFLVEPYVHAVFSEMQVQVTHLIFIAVHGREKLSMGVRIRSYPSRFWSDGEVISQNLVLPCSPSETKFSDLLDHIINLIESQMRSQGKTQYVIRQFFSQGKVTALVA